MVEIGDKERTISKLTYGLTKPVCYLRKCKVYDVCSGFYFVLETPDQVVRVDVRWDDNHVWKLVQKSAKLPRLHIIIKSHVQCAYNYLFVSYSIVQLLLS